MTRKAKNMVLHDFLWVRCRLLCPPHCLPYPGKAGGFAKWPSEPYRTSVAALAGRSDYVLPMLRMKREYLLICRIHVSRAAKTLDIWQARRGRTEANHRPRKNQITIGIEQMYRERQKQSRWIPAFAGVPEEQAIYPQESRQSQKHTSELKWRLYL